eukprot:7343356-Alexandrium_andersonii.AAC.1
MSASLVGSEMCIRDSSGASGVNLEAVPGPAQFKLRTSSQAISHFLGADSCHLYTSDAADDM